MCPRTRYVSTEGGVPGAKEEQPGTCFLKLHNIKGARPDWPPGPELMTDQQKVRGWAHRVTLDPTALPRTRGAQAARPQHWEGKATSPPIGMANIPEDNATSELRKAHWIWPSPDTCKVVSPTPVDPRDGRDRRGRLPLKGTDCTF